MGIPWLISAFMLVMVSGGSLLTLAASSLLLGSLQVIVSTFINPILGGLTIATCAAIVLRVRPEGFARA
jgi:branched-chain amino acid transport system permease protein